MLRFDLTELVRTPGMRRVYDINEPPYSDDDVEYISPLIATLTVTNTGSMILVRGPFHALIAMECSRCLKPVRASIDVVFEEEFDIRVVEDSTRREKIVEVVEDELCRVFDEKVFQADVLFRQAALLAAPLQPLCSETCPGIPIKSAGAEETSKQSPFEELARYFTDEEKN